MEYLKKPTWNRYSGEELGQLVVQAPDEDTRRKVLKNWDTVAKPIDSLGRFETLTAQIELSLVPIKWTFPERLLLSCARITELLKRESASRDRR